MTILFPDRFDIALDVDKYLQRIDDVWRADLVHMRSLSLHNDVTKHLLTCIDTFSKYAWVRPLKNKSGPCLQEALKKHSNLY